jgi:hypothetical protein
LTGEVCHAPDAAAGIRGTPGTPGRQVGDTMHGIGVLTPNPAVADHVDTSLVKE